MRRLVRVAARSIATWGSLHELASVQESCAAAVSEIAACQRLHADPETLAEAAAELAMAAETLAQIAGRYVTAMQLERALDAEEAELEMHRACHVPMGALQSER